jgi:hypothetical protein
MRKTRVLFAILSVLLLFGCNNHENDNKIEIAQNDLSSDTVEIQNKTFELEPPLDITSLSEVEQLDWNSGVANSKNEYCYNSSDGHYGFYSLIDKRKLKTNNIDEILVGRILIHRKKSKSVWTEKDTTQKIQRIELRSDILTLWQELKVGLSNEDLLNFIGDNFHYQKGTVLYAELPGYNCNFTILSDTIAEIIIDKKCT